MSDFLKTDQGKYLAGLGIGVVLGMAIQRQLGKSKRLPDIKIDHVVSNFTMSEDKFRKALQFWGKEGAGFDIVRMKEYDGFVKSTKAIRKELSKQDLVPEDYINRG